MTRSARSRRPFADRSVLAATSLLVAGLGGAVLLLDVWVLAVVWGANYRRWPSHGRSEPAHPWLWLGAVPLTAALLISCAYALRKLSRRLDHPEPKAPAEENHH